MRSQDHFDRDPKTGFLVPKNQATNLVQLQEKLDFLKAFKESANFSKSAKMVGRSKTTGCNRRERNNIRSSFFSTTFILFSQRTRRKPCC